MPVKLKNAIFYSNIYIALAAALLTLQTKAIYGLPLSLPLFWFVFFSTIATYSFQRLVKARAKGKQWPVNSWIIKKRIPIIALTVASAVTAGAIFLAALNIELLALLLPAFLLSVLYALPAIRIKEKSIRLRDIPYLKIFLIALVWSLITVLVPIAHHNEFSFLKKPDVLLMFLQRALFILAITIPFDVRDLQKDMSEGLKTIPAAIGIEKSKALAQLLLAGFALITVTRFYCFEYMNIEILLALLISASATGFLISKTTASSPEDFYRFGMDGMMILQSLLVLLFYAVF